MKRLKKAAVAALLLAGLTAGCSGGGPRQMAEYELKKAAPEEWEAHQKAYDGLEKAQKAMKKAAPNEWRALKAALEKREKALQKLEETEKPYLTAKAAADKTENAYRIANAKLERAWKARENTTPETFLRKQADDRHAAARAEFHVAYQKRNEALAKNELKLTAHQRNERELRAANRASVEAAQAFAEAAPKETAVMRAYQADLIAAQKALAQKAPYWWKAYQAAMDQTEPPYISSLLDKKDDTEGWTDGIRHGNPPIPAVERIRNPVKAGRIEIPLTRTRIENP